MTRRMEQAEGTAQASSSPSPRGNTCDIPRTRPGLPTNKGKGFRCLPRRWGKLRRTKNYVPLLPPAYWHVLDTGRVTSPQGLGCLDDDTSLEAKGSLGGHLQRLSFRVRWAGLIQLCFLAAGWPRREGR